ncbi:MAG TPA: hypothetical protein VGG25_25010 [Streptosporangiaceae bacterium]
MPGTHIMVIHRWRDSYARYADYLDHSRFTVSYITTGLGRQSVPPAAAGVVTVAATDDLAQIRDAAARLAARLGPPRCLVALNEGDLDTAALLRAELGCDGLLPGELARFRDKLAMAQAIAKAGIAIPAFADAPDRAAVTRFAARHGWPVIVKPRRGTASRGVLRLDSPAGLDAMDEMPPEPRLVQAYCGDPIYHIDGVWTGSRLGPWRASRYVNPPALFTHGDVLGSAEVDDQDVLAALEPFTAAVGAALSDRPWVFHLEAFVGSAPGGGQRVTFLEVGYRCGGADIAFVWREVHGVDLMGAAMAVALGRQPAAGPIRAPRVAGWLLLPTPVPAPCRVTAVDVPGTGEGGPYAVAVPAVGDVIPATGGYEHVGARFRFSGDSTQDVEKAIISTASRTRLDCVPELTQEG